MLIPKKKWEELEKRQTELDTKVNILLNERNTEIKELREQVKKYEDVKELLKPIKLKVKKVLYSETSETVIIEYETPTVILEFDNGEQITRNDFLKSVNLLNIIGLEDQMKIQNEINKAKERRTDGK